MNKNEDLKSGDQPVENNPAINEMDQQLAEIAKMETTEKLETPEGYKNVKIDGEDVLCREVDITQEYGEALKEAKEYKKKAVVDARQATEHEEISTSQDGMKNYAEEGDWIIQNPGEDPYVFGSKNDSIEVRQQKFSKKYEPIPDQEGKFQAKGIIKALQVNENIVVKTSWGEEMATKAGGWVSDGGYTIAEKSFADTYEELEDESEDGK